MPSDKFYFSEPFASQLERAMKGHSPWKDNTATAEKFKAKAMASKPPSDKQIHWLKKNGKEIPETMAEAGKMLDEIFGKQSA